MTGVRLSRYGSQVGLHDPKLTLEQRKHHGSCNTLRVVCCEQDLAKTVRYMRLYRGVDADNVQLSRASWFTCFVCARRILS
jgi:hypothetical protein